MHCVGHIAELWRYPIKSMGGERCPTLDLTETGIAGDRLRAFTSADAPPGKPLLRAAQRAAMLRNDAITAPDGSILISNNHGDRCYADDSATPARLTRACDLSATLTLLRSSRPLTDVRPVALHSTAAAATLTQEMSRPFDDRRLRSNLVLALHPAPTPFPEDLLLGHTIQIGDHAQLQILERIPRCRMVALAPGTAAHDAQILPHLLRHHGSRAGIYARTVTPGRIRQHDAIYLLL